MSAPDFEGSLEFSVSMIHEASRLKSQEIALAERLSLVQFVNFINHLEPTLKVRVTTTIWPHEDSGADVATWDEVSTVAAFRS